MKEKKEIKRGRRYVQRLMTFVCVTVLGVSAFQLGSILLDYRENGQVMTDIQLIYEDQQTSMTESNDNREVFDSLLAINDDIVGWITMDGTKIDYPILQAEDNDYYLDRNYLHDKTRAGSIFMDYRNDITGADKHTILYGHRMRDGSMFGQLDEFLDQDFVSKHNRFYYDTLYDSYEVEIFSVYVTTTDFYYIETEFSHQDEFDQFINELKAKSDIHTDVEVGKHDHILTLSTCDYRLNRETGRLVVHGKIANF
ncbi:class B sortase [Salipaludibacillus sp. LMS25]|jgi:sortase B|uniref:class B sortase n=1 Tax=Salipaludibacillus sp. LMS25 TaxID=2924031 RepID=UPI0020D0E69C|nr:class B sortase [Salipaludibacillus sp. LMS25]UTR15444.1 class B sortase [Salipaludibacillus sp. LMS25]